MKQPLRSDPPPLLQLIPSISKDQLYADYVRGYSRPGRLDHDRIGKHIVKQPFQRHSVTTYLAH